MGSDNVISTGVIQSEGEIIDEPFETAVLPSWRVITIKGVTDAIKG